MDKELFKQYIDQMRAMKASASLPEETPTPRTETENSPDMPGTGRLIVNVTSLRGLYPVSMAEVTVFTEKDGQERVIARAVTDMSGKTPTLELAAPSGELSEAPDPSERPYAYYNIRTIADGFLDNINLNVAVFDGVTSVQSVSLQPRTTGVDGNRPIVIDEYENYTL